MDTTSAENCSWEEDGGVKNVNGDCGRQGNKLCAFNKPKGIQFFRSECVNNIPTFIEVYGYPSS